MQATIKLQTAVSAISTITLPWRALSLAHRVLLSTTANNALTPPLAQLVILDTQLQHAAHAVADTMTQMLMLTYSYAVHVPPTATAVIVADA